MEFTVKLPFGDDDSFSGQKVWAGVFYEVVKIEE
jgi:hypothetical protein